MAVEAGRSPTTRRPLLPRLPRVWRVRLAKSGRFLGAHVFSSLTRRIVVVNVIGLGVLLSGILYLNQFRAGLIDARVQSLLTQGEIIAGAVAASAVLADDGVGQDPDAMLDLDPGDMSPDEMTMPEFTINPERVAPVLRRLIQPARLRARIYDTQGHLVLESRFLYQRGQLGRTEAAPEPHQDNFLQHLWRGVRIAFGERELPRYVELGASEGRDYPEVARALVGESDSVVRINDRGELIVSVAVPVQRNRNVLGSLLLSTLGGDIDAIVQAERWAILRVFLVALGVMVLLSVILAGTIAGPMRRLSAAAERVGKGTHGREAIPDFSDRQDEIGHLARSLNDMTAALYQRIDAIESFAADVAHELKNPLTSLRSAVETLPLAKREEDRARLVEIVRHDVRRLDRLISDISDASRLDAEMQREDLAPVDLVQLLETVVAIQNDTRRPGDAHVALDIQMPGAGRKAFVVPGHDSRIGQVIANLLANARSFSPPDGEVRVVARRDGTMVEILVDDDGPGIRVEPIERIFERFYTDRPQSAFGDNSGLGLSISRQIMRGHGGSIRAENRRAPGGGMAGARFVVRLPAA